MRTLDSGESQTCSYLIVSKRLKFIPRFPQAAPFGLWIAPFHSVSGRELLKKIYLLLCLSFLLAPQNVLAEDDDDSHHHRSGAPEMPALGFGAAIAIGIAGYLVLRRRHPSQN